MPQRSTEFSREEKKNNSHRKVSIFEVRSIEIDSDMPSKKNCWKSEKKFSWLMLQLFRF